MYVGGFKERLSQVYRGQDWIALRDLEMYLDLFACRLSNRYLPVSVGDFDVTSLLDAGVFPKLEGERPVSLSDSAGRIRSPPLRGRLGTA